MLAGDLFHPFLILPVCDAQKNPLLMTDVSDFLYPNPEIEGFGMLCSM